MEQHAKLNQSDSVIFASKILDFIFLFIITVKSVFHLSQIETKGKQNVFKLRLSQYFSTVLINMVTERYRKINSVNSKEEKFQKYVAVWY